MTLTYRSTVGRRLTVTEGDLNVYNLAQASTQVFLQSGTGASAITVQALGRLSYWPEQFGAVGDGSTDDVTKIQAAINALDTAGGGRLNLAAKTYICSDNLTLPHNVELVGSGKQSTILLFTGATDGIEIADSVQLSVRIADLQIQTSNASATKAIYFNVKTTGGATGCLIQNVEISVAGSGMWAHGLWATAFQTSELRSLRINLSATVCVHLEYGCNALNFYNCELRGSDTTTYGLIMDTTSGTGGTDAFEIFWLGGTIQRVFSAAAIHSTGCDPKVFALHLENTDTTPSDGADIVIVGTSKNASFNGLQGGSLITSGTVRNLQIHDSEMTDITLASGCNFANIISTRFATLTDSGTGNNVFGCSDSSGNQFANKVVALAKLALKRVVPTFSSPITIDCSLGNVFEIIASTNGNFTIDPPTNGTDGQRITIRVFNTSGGAMGTITWNATFKMSSWTNPATGFNRSVDFLYDGSNWGQIVATGVDVAN